MADLHENKKEEYSEEEIFLIKKHYPNLDLLCSLLPKRKRKQIISKASRLGLSKKNNEKFTQEEIDIIEKNYPSNGGKYVQEHFLPHRKLYEIHNKAFLMGVAHLTYNENYFEKIDSNEKAYWLGFIYADGYITKNTSRFGIELKIGDLPHLQNFVDAIDSNMKIRTRIRKNKFEKQNQEFLESCSILINNKKLHDDLLNLGVDSTKTSSLKFPSKDILPNLFLYDFFRGFIDGDGTIGLFNNYNIADGKTYKKPHVSFVCKSNSFIYDFQKVVKELGFDFHVDCHTKDGLFRFISEKQETCLNFLNLLYKNSTEKTRLKRKFEQYVKICNYYNKDGRS